MNPVKKRAKLDIAGSNQSSFFKEFFNYTNSTGKFDLLHFYRSKSPNFPTNDITMTFTQEKFKNVILVNICVQNMTIQDATVKEVMTFLEKNFNSEAEAVILQVFVHITNYDRKSMKLKVGQTVAQCYEEILITYVRRATEIFGKNKIRRVSGKTEHCIKSNLSKTRFLAAFKKTLTELDDKELNEKVNHLFVENMLQKASIYFAESFTPYAALRGAVLTNGIFICEMNLAFPPLDIDNPDTYGNLFKSELFTISSHEFSNFLVRSHFGNFSFSSPFKHNNRDEVRFDREERTKFLEMGRSMELNLFDGIQAGWHRSAIMAANRFLDRLDEPGDDLPFINKDDRKDLKLRDRPPSLPMGIDSLEEESSLEC